MFVRTCAKHGKRWYGTETLAVQAMHELAEPDLNVYRCKAAKDEQWHVGHLPVWMRKLAQVKDKPELVYASATPASRNGRAGTCRGCRKVKVIHTGGRCGSCYTWFRWHRANGYQTVLPTFLHAGDILIAEDAGYRIYRVRHMPDEIAPKVHLRTVRIGTCRHVPMLLDADSYVPVEVSDAAC